MKNHSFIHGIPEEALNVFQTDRTSENNQTFFTSIKKSSEKIPTSIFSKSNRITDSVKQSVHQFQNV
jgi:hypothetical protein